MSPLAWSRWAASLLTAAYAWGQVPAPVPSVQLIVARIEEARNLNRNKLRSYQVVRNYKFFGKEQEKTKSEVNVDIMFVPPDVERYLIRKAEGMDMGKTIVRKILESENEVLSAQKASDISPDNYTFRYLREDRLDGHACHVLEIDPKRKDTKLVRGIVWVDAGTYLIRRVAGEPAKSPSWWVHDIHVTLDFRDVNGMWLQTA